MARHTKCRTKLVEISQLVGDGQRGRAPQHKRDEDERGGAQQRPARRRRSGSSVDSEQPGAHAARAQHSDYSKRDDNEEQHGNLARPLHG